MDRTELIDKYLPCRDCKRDFLFSVAEQEFFREKALSNLPKRCANCRLLLRTQRLGVPTERTAEVGCTSCGLPTRVPFQPNGHKPVLCNVCFHQQKLTEPSSPREEQEKQLVLV